MWPTVVSFLRSTAAAGRGGHAEVSHVRGRGGSGSTVFGVGPGKDWGGQPWRGPGGRSGGSLPQSGHHHGHIIATRGGRRCQQLVGQAARALSDRPRNGGYRVGVEKGYRGRPGARTPAINSGHARKRPPETPSRTHSPEITSMGCRAGPYGGDAGVLHKSPRNGRTLVGVLRTPLSNDESEQEG